MLNLLLIGMHIGKDTIARIQKRRNVKSAGVTEIDLEQARDGFDIMNLNGNYHCGDTRNTKTLVKSG